MFICFCSKAVGRFVLAGTVRGFCVLFPHHTPLSHSFSLFGDLFVYQVLFAFGFGHQFFRWFSVSVWG